MMETERLARAILNRDEQITLLSYQLQDHLSKIDSLEREFEDLKKQNLELTKKLEKKNIMIQQESADVALIKNKIEKMQAKTWGESFSSLKSWIGEKLPRKYFGPKTVHE